MPASNEPRVRVLLKKKEHGEHLVAQNGMQLVERALAFQVERDVQHGFDFFLAKSRSPIKSRPRKNVCMCLVSSLIVLWSGSRSSDSR